MCGCPSPRRARLQIGLFLLAYAVYTVARFFTIGDLADATANAHWIVDLQNAVGVGVESSVQNALDGSWVMWVLNRLYLAAQLGVIPAVLIFLYNRSWAIYATLRNTILATWLISVPVYGLFPVAPPRLAGHRHQGHDHLADGHEHDVELLDELLQRARRGARRCTWASPWPSASRCSRCCKNPVLKWVALLWGPIVGLAVVATGNHFVFDAVAGLAAAALGYGLVLMAARIRVKRPTPSSLARAFAEA